MQAPKKTTKIHLMAKRQLKRISRKRETEENTEKSVFEGISQDYFRELKKVNVI